MNRVQIVEQLPGLRRYARALTGDAWAADDLVQDTLERACRKWLLWRGGDLPPSAVPVIRLGSWG